jgi:hypothetical protein
MEAWVIVCWFLNRPATEKNIRLLGMHHTEHQCRQQVQALKAGGDLAHSITKLSFIKKTDCSCFNSHYEELYDKYHK